MPNEISFVIGARRKKKSATSIVHPSFFDNTAQVVPSSAEAKKTANTTPQIPAKTETVEQKPIESKPIESKTIEAPNVHISKRRGSALSLKSIQQKKELLQQKKKVIQDPTDLPKNEFTEQQLLHFWIDYGKRMDKKGERIIGSMFAMNKPVLKENNVIFLELPNQTMKVDIENIEKPLLNFLHEKLSNYSITLHINVNEVMAKKHAFTPQDKYDKLKEQNPFLDLLRSKFDLDL